jgi:hypothetical protein
MKVDLSKVKVGDKIWTIQEGWVTVRSTSYIIKEYPICAGLSSYTIDGKIDSTNKYPSAFLEYPFKEQPIEKDTIVYYKDFDHHNWGIGYYSHFENGMHFVFDSSKKSTQTTEYTRWSIVTTENPLL